MELHEFVSDSEDELNFNEENELVVRLFYRARDRPNMRSLVVPVVNPMQVGDSLFLLSLPASPSSDCPSFPSSPDAALTPPPVAYEDQCVPEDTEFDEVGIRIPSDSLESFVSSLQEEVDK